MEIEWQETHEYRPEIVSLNRFCRVHPSGWEKGRNNKPVMALAARKTLESLHDHLAADPHREHGGVLVGKPYFDPDARQYYVVIRGVIPAFHSSGSPVHLQFTPQAWEYIAGIQQESYPEQMVVGWYHSHPGLGVFMSGTDRATQAAFYAHPWNIAVVVDPLARRSGWFLGEACQPMTGAQVMVLDGADDLDEPVEAAPQPERGGRTAAFRWLLPVGFILLTLALVVWFFGRDRLNGGMV